ncbi:MAG: hypothetical protein HFG27_08455 [Provencibacterium sp.]|nr:hypothetical protein [Provencibacterium sp.]
MSRFPSPPDVEQAILEGPMKASRYLFFRSKRVKDGCTGKQVRRYYGYCTHCKQEHLLSEKPQHKSGGRCPGCGSEVTMMARGIQRSFLADRCEYMVFSKDQEGNVYLHHLHVVRDYAGIPEQVQTRIQEVSRYYFTGMHAYKFTRRYNAYQQPNPAEKWEKNVRCSEPSDANGLLKYTIHPIPWGFFDDTCLSNARLGEYLQSTAGSSEASVYYRIHAERQNPIQYLNFYLKHPNIENLITAELMHLVLDILKKPGDFRKIRLDKARPRDILGLSQPEVRMAAKYKMSFQDINMYKRCKEILHAIDAEDLSIILEFSKALPGRLDDMIAAERLRKDLTYCKRQKHRGEYPSYVILYCQWEDYHRECRQLGYDLSDEYYHYPPDLQKAHRRTMEQVAEKERQKLEKQQQEELPKWAALYHELEGLCYSDGQLLIRPVASRAELVEEGTKLHHCVASYGNRVVEGKTWIFFIRKVEDPDSPYYTLNLSPECELIQCHGYGNDADQPEKIRPQFIRDFEKKWLEKVVKPWKKRRDKEKAEICIQIPAA